MKKMKKWKKRRREQKGIKWKNGKRQKRDKRRKRKNKRKTDEKKLGAATWLGQQVHEICETTWRNRGQNIDLFHNEGCAFSSSGCAAARLHGPEPDRRREVEHAQHAF